MPQFSGHVGTCIFLSQATEARHEALLRVLEEIEVPDVEEVVDTARVTDSCSAHGGGSISNPR